MYVNFIQLQDAELLVAQCLFSVAREDKQDEWRIYVNVGYYGYKQSVMRVAWMLLVIIIILSPLIGLLNSQRLRN